MSPPKQVIVMRKDLNMRRGKQIAQACHASLKVILDTQITRNEEAEEIVLGIYSKAMLEWIDGLFTKICVYVNSEEELLNVYSLAEKKHLPRALIKDAGLTEFNGVPTLTCCAIGPAYPDEFIGITDKLPLL